jgi:hypothetical protein
VWGVIYWPIYLTVAAVAFLVPEVYGLFTNAANTLSEYCWNQLGVTVAFGHGAHTFAWWASQSAFILAAVILVLHIWYRSV